MGKFIASVVVAAVLVPLAACGGGSSASMASTSSTAAQTTSGTQTAPALPGMPRVLNPSNIYSADAPGDFSPAIRGDVPMVYVPNSGSDTVTEINNPSTSSRRGT